MNNATSIPATPRSPSDSTSLLGMILSFSALRDWLKVILMGGVFEVVRQIMSRIMEYLSAIFWFSATVDSEDESYNWIMYWLSKHPSWKDARQVEVTTQHFGLTDPAISVSFPDQDNGKQTTSYMPSVSAEYGMWYKGCYMTIRRSVVPMNTWRTQETLILRLLTRDPGVFVNLLREAKATYDAAREHSISIYVCDTSFNWRQVAARPKRPMDTIVLDPGIKETLLSDAREFTQSRKWYADRGIPFRRGYLLHGAPGTGKTSIIQGLAGELGLDVYIISISRVGLDDTTLNQLILDLPQKCIALMEDIDAAFHHGLSRKFSTPKQAQSHSPSGLAADSSGQQAGPQENENHSRITLSGLLNALDGVSAQEGRILYATTNCYEALDPALCRPGRMDVHVEFKLASKFQARELFKRFYMPTGSLNDGDAKKAEKESADEETNDSGFASTTSDCGDLIDLECTTSTYHETLLDSSDGSSDKEVRPGAIGLDSALASLSSHQVHRLAAKFAQIIPDRELSMASLQGYLMVYKSRPYDSVRDAAAWVAAQREERAKRSMSGRSTSDRDNPQAI